MGSGNGSLTLDLETVSSKYLLLHTSGDTVSGQGEMLAEYIVYPVIGINVVTALMCLNGWLD
jgi:hypothetical protein